MKKLIVWSASPIIADEMKEIDAKLIEWHSTDGDETSTFSRFRDLALEVIMDRSKACEIVRILLSGAQAPVDEVHIYGELPALLRHSFLHMCQLLFPEGRRKMQVYIYERWLIPIRDQVPEFKG